MATTGRDKIKEGFGDGVPHFSYAAYNDLASVETWSIRIPAAIMELVNQEFVSREQALSKFWLIFANERILLIVDEVQTGMGRTGQLDL